MGDFPHSEMLNDIRDIMTFDIRDPPRKKINNFWQNIREPQWKCCNFALGIKAYPAPPKGREVSPL